MCENERNDPCYSTAQPPSKRPANDKSTSYLWGCLSETLSEASTLSNEGHDTDSISCEVEKYLAEPLLHFKGNSPFKWWAANRNAYLLLCELYSKKIIEYTANKCRI